MEKHGYFLENKLDDLKVSLWDNKLESQAGLTHKLCICLGWLKHTDFDEGF